ncbi:MAG: rhomboid family intramembrane serine protease [Bacteroidota bacterium]
MLHSIWDDIKQEIDYGNMIKRIIIVNIAVYVIVNLVWLFTPASYQAFYKEFVHFFSVGGSWWHNLIHPWVPFTHMFLHEGFFHILWNMLFLFWFGRIFGDLLGDRRVLPLYILGGLAGAVFYFIAANIPGTGVSEASFALGASAAVLAILVSAGVFAPNYGIQLLFIGTVKLKWIVLALVFMNVLGTRGIDNVGGAWGHLGGITMGFLFSYQLQAGNDWSKPVNRIWDNILNFFRSLSTTRKPKSRPGPRAAYRRGQEVKAGASPRKRQKGRTGASKILDEGKSHQEQLDAILDKIKDRGYNSLNQEEKEFLFRASNK